MSYFTGGWPMLIIYHCFRTQWRLSSVILAFLLWLTDNYISVSVSVPCRARDHLHIYFSCWWRPEFVLQSLTKINSYQVYNTIWSSANLISSIVLTWAAACWVRWPTSQSSQPYVVLFIWILLLSVGSNGDECWWNSSNGNFPNYTKITAALADVICSNGKLFVFCF